MPFILVDDAENEFVELPPGVTPDQLSKLITEVLSEQLTKLVDRAIRRGIYDVTGKMDYYDAPEQPRGKR